VLEDAQQAASAARADMLAATQEAAGTKKQLLEAEDRIDELQRQHQQVLVDIQPSSLAMQKLEAELAHAQEVSAQQQQQSADLQMALVSAQQVCFRNLLACINL
jgi:chromosome segregation ATPase